MEKIETASMKQKKEDVRKSMEDALAEYLSKGGQITKCKVGESVRVEGASTSMWGRPGKKKKTETEEIEA